mmetsp:Transcript_28649/g.38191  ORF Transcript_28649/g.38191 Transcript_28649/m.38191 type:complete len:112 (+) Transcript_28649:1000-1335(+)
MALSDHTHEEFLMATRLNFAGWRMVDLDNFMGGNPPFTQKDIKDPWERLPDFQNIEQQVGEDLNKQPLEKRAKENMIASVHEALRKLDNYEPNSNARVGLELATKTSESNE